MKLRVLIQAGFTFGLIMTGVMVLTPDANAFGRSSSKETVAQETCQSTREFVTTMRFLSSEKVIAADPMRAQQLAEQVARGCTGAAGRFIEVTETLRRSGISSEDAVKAGLEYALADGERTATFVTVFTHAYAQDGLDLDAGTALTMARSLSTGFDGDQKRARSDFARLVRFCAGGNGLDLPRPRCAQMAARLTGYGRGFSKGIAGPFIDAYEYLTDRDGPALTTGDAVQVAEELMKNGPAAAENFTRAYRYAVQESGLNLDRAGAIGFGRRMASLSRPSEAAPKAGHSPGRRGQDEAPTVKNRRPAARSGN